MEIRLVDSSDIVAFIRKNYVGKVVEIGVGRQDSVAIKLSQYFSVVVTDIIDAGEISEKLKEFYIRDDVSNPNLAIYEGANLIYSIRPPTEIQSDILNLAENVGSNALIRPLGHEIINDNRLTLKNVGRATLYIYKVC